MKLINPLCVGILSPLSLERSMDFLWGVRGLVETIPELNPEKWGWWEPLNQNFDASNLEALVPPDGICRTVYWKRGKRPKCEGSFVVRWRSNSPAVRDTHCRISIDMELGAIDQERLVAYLKRECVRLRADFALVDVVTKECSAIGIENDSVPYGSRIMVTTHLLRHWLPDVFWGTVFGPAYVRFFGKNRLLSASAYLVEDLGPEMVYVQLTEKLAHAIDCSEELQLAREAFKRHFDNNAFFITGSGYDRLQRGPVGDVFNVPDFKLDDENPMA